MLLAAPVFLGLAGCSGGGGGGGVVAGEAVGSGFEDDGPAVDDTSVSAWSVLSCQEIALERNALAATIRQSAAAQQMHVKPAASDDSAALQDQDAALARLAKEKKCPP